MGLSFSKSDIAFWASIFGNSLNNDRKESENVKKPFPFNNGTDEWSKALNRATLISMISLIVSVVVFGVKIALIFG